MSQNSPSPIAQSRIFFQVEAPRPLGGATYAGTIKNSRGLRSHPMRVFGQYALVLQLHGSGLFRDALGTKREITAGDALWVFPEIPHFYGPRRGEIWDEIYICFSGAIFDFWRAQKILDPSRPVVQIAGWRPLFDRLQSWCEKPRETEGALALAQTQELLAILAFFTPSFATATPQSWLETAKSRLQSNLDAPLSPEAVARELGLGYESFRKSFSEKIGVSPAKFRDLARLEAAKVLLRREDMTQKIVAQSLGFRDEAHFSRRFRELSGQSPRQWLQNEKNRQPL